MVSLAASLGWDCILTVIHLANDSHIIDEPWLLPCLGSLQGFPGSGFCCATITYIIPPGTVARDGSIRFHFEPQSKCDNATQPHPVTFDSYDTSLLPPV